MRSITVRTNQNVDIDYELAPTMSRVGAFALDVLFFVGCYVILLLFLRPLLLDGGPRDVDYVTYNERQQQRSMVLYGFLPLFLFLTYYFFCEMLTRGQTVGKRITQTQVIRVDGLELTPGDYLMRTFMLLPDVVFSLGIPAILLINSTPKAQRIGDMVANTAVIRSNNLSALTLEDILRIKTTSSYEPVFPEVTRLSEEDMLVIKRGLVRYRRYRNKPHQQAVDRLAEIARDKLDISTTNAGKPQMSNVQLLDTLLKDYIVLTR
ncbi:MAG: RDD family protein [Bacteroidota bacterium]